LAEKNGIEGTSIELLNSSCKIFRRYS